MTQRLDPTPTFPSTAGHPGSVNAPNDLQDVVAAASVNPAFQADIDGLAYLSQLVFGGPSGAPNAQPPAIALDGRGSGVARIQFVATVDELAALPANPGDVAIIQNPTAPSSAAGLYVFNPFGLLPSDGFYVQSAVPVAWTSSTDFLAGSWVTNDSGKLYYCVQGGRSAGSGGPTGTGSNIADNTCRWDYHATVGQWVNLIQAFLNAPAGIPQNPAVLPAHDTVAVLKSSGRLDKVALPSEKTLVTLHPTAGAGTVAIPSALAAFTNDAAGNVTTKPIVATSAGAGDAAKLPELNGSGLIDYTMLPNTFMRSASNTGHFSGSATTYTDVTNATLDITVVAGRPVDIGFISGDNNAEASYIATDQNGHGSVSANFRMVITKSGGSPAYFGQQAMGSANSSDHVTYFPASSYSGKWVPASSGLYTIKIQYLAVSAATIIYVWNADLFANQL